jgi:hypothetical protein
MVETEKITPPRPRERKVGKRPPRKERKKRREKRIRTQSRRPGFEAGRRDVRKINGHTEMER